MTTRTGADQWGRASVRSSFGTRWRRLFAKRQHTRSAWVVEEGGAGESLCHRRCRFGDVVSTVAERQSYLAGPLALGVETVDAPSRMVKEVARMAAVLLKKCQHTPLYLFQADVVEEAVLRVVDVEDDLAYAQAFRSSLGQDFQYLVSHVQKKPQLKRMSCGSL